MLSTQPEATPLTEDLFSLDGLKAAAAPVTLADEDDGRQEFKDRPRPPPVTDSQKELVKLLTGLSGRHHHWQVFSDFCEMAAITFSNAVDRLHYDEREKRYMEIVKRYDRKEVEAFPHGLALLTMALEDGFGDVLGRTFHDLELHSKWAGQFFTPYDLSRLMAKMTIGDCDDLKARIAARGFVTAQEPAVGSGSMVIALAEAMHDAGVNYQEHLHVTAIDVDAKCVHMAYLQFSLLHIPAVIIHGNALSLEEYDRWHTPAHIMGGWDWKLRLRSGIEAAQKILTLPEIEMAPVEPIPEPMSGGPPRQLKLF